MYLLEEILLTLPFVLYVGWRIYRLFTSPILKAAWAVFFILLLIGYPMGEGSIKFEPVALACLYSLPFLLYLLLTGIPADLVVGLLRTTKILSSETVRGRTVRRIRLAVMLGVPAAVLVAGIINFNTLRWKDYAIEIPRKSSSLSGLTIAFASDFHLGEFTSPRLVDEFAAMVAARKPDLVLIGGDVVEGHGGEEKLDRFAAAFRSIRPRYGVYGVPGNHEGYGRNRMDFFEEAGIRLLPDRVIKIDGAFYLAGRSFSRRQPRVPVADLLGDVPDDLPIILMDHSPGDIDAVSETRTDVQFSGHTHHGQLFPVNFITRHRYKLSWGHKVFGRTHLFVSSGIQLWGPPVRTVGASEILMVKIDFKNP